MTKHAAPTPRTDLAAGTDNGGREPEFRDAIADFIHLGEQLLAAERSRPTSQSRMNRPQAERIFALCLGFLPHAKDIIGIRDRQGPHSLANKRLLQAGAEPVDETIPPRSARAQS